MATIPELLDGHITLDLECLYRLYLNSYIGKLATGSGWVNYKNFDLKQYFKEGRCCRPKGRFATPMILESTKG